MIIYQHTCTHTMLKQAGKFIDFLQPKKENVNVVFLLLSSILPSVTVSLEAEIKVAIILSKV